MLEWRPYLAQRAGWPRTGRHILAQYDDESVIVYQAYRAAIADWAIAHQQFGGPWKFDRMSWIKPNFLWMMYRCGWATKRDQERVLAIRMARDGFETILAQAVETRHRPDATGWSVQEYETAGKRTEVRMQWDPDHNPTGAPTERRAIQLGLRRATLRQFATDWIHEIFDITPEVQAHHANATPSRYEALQTPFERPYTPRYPAVRTRLRLA
ncbi:MAG: DUF4291 domain-containing protein [Myxococcota bacterium]